MFHISSPQEMHWLFSALTLCRLLHLLSYYLPLSVLPPSSPQFASSAFRLRSVGGGYPGSRCRLQVLSPNAALILPQGDGAANDARDNYGTGPDAELVPIVIAQSFAF
ncbi:hypothetical protein EV363DRAFT_136875 [Boletus edulis]|nr:hypothetical protein EV363DRAFT_136875 [Boletus edulis]